MGRSMSKLAFLVATDQTTYYDSEILTFLKD